MREVSESILDKFSSVDMSATINGPIILLDSIYGFAIHVGWTGATATGNIKLQASVDPKNQVGGPVNWEDIPDSTVAVTGPSSVLWNFNGAFYEWVKVVYVFSSGTGTITLANMKLKGV